MPSNALNFPLPSTSQGPVVNDRATAIILLSPVQLVKTPLLTSFNKICNESYRQAQIKTGVMKADRRRLPEENSVVAAVGDDADSFTYVMYYTGTDEVVATISFRRYYSVPLIDGASPADRTFERVGNVPADTQAWEMKLLCVAINAQKQGLAAIMIDMGEAEVLRRFQSQVAASGLNNGTAPKHLLYCLSTVKEEYFQFYLRRGYSSDYEAVLPPGTLGSVNGFEIAHLSKIWKADTA